MVNKVYKCIIKRTEMDIIERGSHTSEFIQSHCHSQLINEKLFEIAI